MIIVEVPIVGWPADKPFTYAARDMTQARSLLPRGQDGPATFYRWSGTKDRPVLEERFVL